MLSHMNLLINTYTKIATHAITGDGEVWLSGLSLCHIAGVSGRPRVLQEADRDQDRRCPAAQRERQGAEERAARVDQLTYQPLTSAIRSLVDWV